MHTDHTDLKKSQEIQWDIEKIKQAYREAAEADRFLFGDYDYSHIWKNTESNDIS